MAARILPACRVCGKPCNTARNKFCSLACRDAVPRPHPRARKIEPAILASGMSVDDWLALNYWAEGCNLSTASARLGVSKRSLWAFLRSSGRPTKAQGPSQVGDLNPFRGRSHRIDSIALIGQSSEARQPRMLRRSTGQYGEGPPIRGADHPAYVSGIGNYRAEAFARYGSACTQCGKRGTGRQIDVHHRDGDRSNNAIDNLLVLCRGCHIRLHRRQAVQHEDMHR